MDGKRSFTIVHLTSRNKIKSKAGGRYISNSAQRAAIKAFNRECKKSKVKGQCTLVIIMRETTSKSKHKLYRYKMKRVKLKTPKKMTRNGTTYLIKYKTIAKQIKPQNYKRWIKRIGGMAGGAGMDMEMEDDEDEGIFTGFYNIIANNKIIHSDYFILEDEEPQSELVRKVMKKHKKDLKQSGLKNIAIEIFDVMFYPREEGVAAIRSALNYQLPIIKADMNRLNAEAVATRRRDAFDFSDLSNLLDSM